MGGLIAYQLAILLKQKKREVPIVFIVDQPPRMKYHKMNFWIDNIWKGSHMMKQNIIQRYKKYKQEKNTSKGIFGILDKITGGSEKEKQIEDVPVAPEVILDPSAFKLVRELELHMKAGRDYIPPLYDGAIHVFECPAKEKKLAVFQDWKNLAPAVTFSKISGDHYNCMKEPFIQELAADITKLMDEVIFKTTGIPRESKIQMKVKVISMSRIVHRSSQDPAPSPK